MIFGLVESASAREEIKQDITIGISSYLFAGAWCGFITLLISIVTMVSAKKNTYKWVSCAGDDYTM